MLSSNLSFSFETTLSARSNKAVSISNEKDKIEEQHHILAALQQNCYPKEFIQRTVKKHNKRKEQPRERHTHTHTPCLMMGEVSLETSPKKHYDPRHDKPRKQYEYNCIDKHNHIKKCSVS